MSAAPPVNDDTGVIIPENCVAGSTVGMAVPNSAAIWVRVGTPSLPAQCVQRRSF
jgi:hypothetical protein